VKDFGQDSHCPIQVSNLAPPEYESKALPLEPACPVKE
jgi:hypothetical protein